MLYQSALIAFAACGLYVESAQLLGIPLDWRIVTLVTIVVFGAYRYAPYMLDKSTCIPFLSVRTGFANAFSLVSAALALGVAIYLNSGWLFMLLLCLALYWVYQVGRPFAARPLRNQGWIKPLTIAIAWTSCVAIGLIDSAGSGLFSIRGSMVLGSMLLFILAMALLCDVADVETDRRTGVMTLPVRYKPHLVMCLAMVIGTAPVLLVFWEGHAGFGQAISLGAMVFCTWSAAIGVLLLPAATSRLLVDVFLFLKPLPLILVSI